jgi:hypothetical protein
VLSATLCSLGIQAQEKLSAIAAPGSPASYIIGVQPSAVLAPKSFQALETSLYSNFLGKEGKTVLPNDFALEFTPYWASDHGMTLDEYLYPRNVFDQWWRNSSFSVASTQAFELEDKTASSGLGFGYRTNFFIGGGSDKAKIAKLTAELKMNQKFRAWIGASISPLLNNQSITTSEAFLKALLPDIGRVLNTTYGTVTDEELGKLSDELKSGLSGLTYNNNDFEDQFKDLLTQKINGIKAVDKSNSAQVIKNFKNYIKARDGFSFDVAYAGFLNFPDNKFSYSIAPRHSAWLTPTYTFGNNPDSTRSAYFKLMGVLRYEWYDTDYYTKYFPAAKNYKDNFDYGLAIAAELKRFSIQLEAVGRYNRTEIQAGTDTDGSKLYKKKTDHDFQCVGTFAYKINKQIALSYSLGSRFEPIINPGSTLVSLLSLNLGFGGPTTEAIK